LILCHGFGGCKEQHAAFAAAALAHGWAVLAFDWRGHGASDGCLDSRAINDIGAALTWLRDQPQVDPERIAVRGASMGGYFALHAARQWPALAGCVAISPPDEPALAQLLRDARDPATPVGAWRAQGQDFPRVMGCDLTCWLEDHDLAAAAAALAPRPLLLISCTGDDRGAVPICERLAAAAAEPKAFWLLDGGPHRFPIYDPATGERTLAWLDSKLPPR
jgi:pimeloyl-ACP methyl ester carboxylesterase